MTRPPLPEPDGWAGKDYYHRPATTPLADISKFTPEQARYTASQMHEYSDACNAALREQVLVLTEALGKEYQRGYKDGWQANDNAKTKETVLVDMAPRGHSTVPVIAPVL